MTESIIQPKTFPKDFCTFDITVVKIDSNTSSISFSIIFFLSLSVNKMCHILFYLHFLSF